MLHDILESGPVNRFWCTIVRSFQRANPAMLKKIIYVVQVETCFYSANKCCANKQIDFYPFSSRYTPLYRQLQMKRGYRVLIWAKPNAKLYHVLSAGYDSIVRYFFWY